LTSPPEGAFFAKFRVSVTGVNNETGSLTESAMGRRPIGDRAMTNAERQARFQAKRLEEYRANHPTPDWLKGAITLEELVAGTTLKLDDEIAAVDDPR